MKAPSYCRWLTLTMDGYASTVRAHSAQGLDYTQLSFFDYSTSVCVCAQCKAQRRPRRSEVKRLFGFVSSFLVIFLFLFFVGCQFRKRGVVVVVADVIVGRKDEHPHASVIHIFAPFFCLVSSVFFFFFFFSSSFFCCCFTFGL